MQIARRSSTRLPQLKKERLCKSSTRTLCVLRAEAKMVARSNGLMLRRLMTCGQEGVSYALVGYRNSERWLA